MNAESIIFSVVYLGLVLVLIWINYDAEVKYPGKTIELTLGTEKIIQRWGIVRGLTIVFLVHVVIWAMAINFPLIGEEVRGFVVGFLSYNVINDLKILLRVSSRE